MEECPADVTVILGDARITMETELATGEPQQFDALFLDPFSGDSIPMHLFTQEAFVTYMKHLSRWHIRN